jgi:hypothetical protein
MTGWHYNYIRSLTSGRPPNTKFHWSVSETKHKDGQTRSFNRTFILQTNKFQDLITTSMKLSVFWDVAWCSPVETDVSQILNASIIWVIALHGPTSQKTDFILFTRNERTTYSKAVRDSCHNSLLIIRVSKNYWSYTAQDTGETEEITEKLTHTSVNCLNPISLTVPLPPDSWIKFNYVFKIPSPQKKKNLGQ